MRFGLERAQSLQKLLKELANGLRKLTFTDNFQSFVAEVELEAGEELTVPHRLQAVPKYYIIGRMSGNGKIIDGSLPFTDRDITIQNVGVDKTTVTLIIFRD